VKRAHEKEINMRLEIDSIDIEDIQTGPKTYAQDRVLYINPKEVEELILKDKRIRSVDINLVYPGDRVRVINLNDVIQPRCKIDQDNADFPGWLGKLTIAGQGRTRSLRGISIIISNPCTKREYSALLDMSGIGARISKYSRMKHICIAPTVSEDTEVLDLENAVKLAGLKTAVYLARAAEGHAVDEVEVYDLDIPNLEMKSDLPRVAHYYQMYAPQRDFYKGISDPVFYGTGVSNILPTIIHPNEVLDGGVINMHTIYGLDTYSIQNHALIKELYERHGKELIFTGVVVGVADIDPVQRQRKAMMAASLASNVLRVDGVILTKVLGGLTQADLGIVADEFEKIGVKTTLFVDMLYSVGSLSEQTIYLSDSLNAAINFGQSLERISLPLKANKILGGTVDTPIYNPDFTQKAGDKVIEIEEALLAGVQDHTGGAKIVAAEY
jgi:sarcosine reductase